MSLTKPAAPPRPASPPRRDTALGFDPFTLDAHGAALIARGVVLAPLLVGWHYRIGRPAPFRDWLGMKEIVLAERRLSTDPLIGGVRYFGTYRVASDAAASYRTLWGYTSQDAMDAMHRLCADPAPSTTIIQMELVDFVRGLRTFMTEAGIEHFRQEVMVAGSIFEP